MYYYYIVYIIKIVLSEIIFWIQNGHPDPEDPNKYTQYETASKILFSVDLTAAFFIQGVLILVCFNWYLLYKRGWTTLSWFSISYLKWKINLMLKYRNPKIALSFKEHAKSYLPFTCMLDSFSSLLWWCFCLHLINIYRSYSICNTAIM